MWERDEPRLGLAVDVFTCGKKPHKKYPAGSTCPIPDDICLLLGSQASKEIRTPATFIMQTLVQINSFYATAYIDTFSIARHGIMLFSPMF